MHMMYLPLPGPSWTAMMGEGGESAVAGQKVDKEDAPVSKPVEAEYDEVIASSTDGQPFRKSLKGDKRRDGQLSSIGSRKIKSGHFFCLIRF